MSKTTITEKSMIFDKKEIFNIVNNGNNETEKKLKISYNNKIIYFEIEEGNIPKNEFTLYQNLEELKKINNYFKQFDNIKDVFESIKILIKDKNVSIIKEEKKSTIKIFNPTVNKTIYIKIPLKQKDIKSEIESLEDYIVQLNDKVNKLETQIKEMKTDFENKLQNIEKKNQEEINNIKKELDNLKAENRMFKCSNIIDSNEEELILSWFDDKPVSFDLLLDVEINDNFLEEFFEKCENKSPTMIFIKTTENLRFGGFTNAFWPREGEARDEESFIFSLTKREKYSVKDPNNAIGVFKNSLISFGNGNDLYLQNCLKSSGGGCHSFYYNINVNDLNGGKEVFHLLNCEVYQVNI